MSVDAVSAPAFSGGSVVGGGPSCRRHPPRPVPGERTARETGMNATEAPVLRAEAITHAFTAMIMAEDNC